MTGLRRGLLLAPLAVTATLALTTTPAQAAFQDTASVTLTTSTTTVAAPTDVRVEARCDTWTLYATGSWKPSTSARVSGYTITAYASTGQVVETFQTDAATTSYSISASRDYAAYGIRVSVTTRTSYGWTTESAKTGAIRC